MNPFSMFVMFLIIWWTILFIVLPMGVRGQAEENDIVEGSEPGAPVESNIKSKFILTTKITIGVWLVFCAVIWSGLLNWEMFGSWLSLKGEL